MKIVKCSLAGFDRLVGVDYTFITINIFYALSIPKTNITIFSKSQIEYTLSITSHIVNVLIRTTRPITNI
jgi:hypothetical protein